jgi:hypothetical protein
MIARRRCVGLVTSLAVVLAGIGCSRAPARLLIGTADTVVVNSTHPVALPRRVLDASGRVLDSLGHSVTFQYTAGPAVPVSPSGTVQCTQPGDVTIRAALGALATHALVRCRPVTTLRMAGPLNLILGDSAQDLPLLALGPDGRPVELLAGQATIVDSTVATLERRGTMRIRPRAVGATLVEVVLGDRSARAGVHVYERVSALPDRPPIQRLVAVPLRLESGEMRRVPLGEGGWMVAMLPSADGRPGPSFRIEGAQCRPALTERRYVCTAGPAAQVLVYHPWRAEPAPARTGELLLRRMSGP